MQILTSPGIDKYAQEKTTDHDELMVSLMKETHEKMDLPQMLTGPVEGCLLKLLVKMSGADAHHARHSLCTLCQRRRLTMHVGLG